MLGRFLDRFRRRNDYVPRHSTLTQARPAGSIPASAPPPVGLPATPAPPPPPPPPGPAEEPAVSAHSATGSGVQVRVFGRDGREAALSPDPEVQDRLGYLADNLLVRRPRD